MGNILYDDQVSLSNVKDFDKNKIILWQGHGTYGGEKLHSLIYTGADFNWDAFNWDISYFWIVVRIELLNVEIANCFRINMLKSIVII